MNSEKEKSNALFGCGVESIDESNIQAFVEGFNHDAYFAEWRQQEFPNVVPDITAIVEGRRIALKFCLVVYTKKWNKRQEERVYKRAMKEILRLDSVFSGLRTDARRLVQGLQDDSYE